VANIKRLPLLDEQNYFSFARLYYALIFMIKFVLDT